MKLLKQKKLVAILAVLVLALASVGAYAYFTTTGTGAGSASVGTSSTIDLSSDPVGTLYPGGSDVPVTVDISNPSDGFQYVGTISGTVTTQGGCLGSWFAIDPITYNAQVAGGGSDTANTNVRMTNANASQDACKGLTMAIAWSSN